MSEDEAPDLRIDRLAAAALRGETVAWPADWSEPQVQSAVVDRMVYHGISGLLLEAEPLRLPWPAGVLDALKADAVQRSMWEMRHRLVLAGVLAAMAERGVRAVILKGTALAYDLYERPASRARGDTDLLVETGGLAEARAILAGQGFVRSDATAMGDGEFELQEIWTHASAGGAEHHIDLHWQTMNAPALENVLTTAECMHAPLALPRLSDAAYAMDRVSMLIHAIVHRAAHISSAVQSGNSVFYGGDRLIWAQDIDMLARALDRSEWTSFCERACSRGVARVCLEGLDFASRHLGTSIPADVPITLGSAPHHQPASSYLLETGRFGRVWRDFLAIRGFRAMVSYLAARVLRSRGFLRTRYPAMAGQPIAFLYFRRMLDLLRGNRQ